MTWRSISQVQDRIRPALPVVPPADALRVGTELADKVFRVKKEDEWPVFAAHTSLGLLMDRLTVHRISQGPVNLVHATDLHTLPGEPPRLLQGTWILEARAPERETLFGRTVNLAGFYHSGTIHVIGHDWPDGAWAARWTPVWGEMDLHEAFPAADDPSVSFGDLDVPHVDPDTFRAAHERAMQAFRFALILGIHLDAEGSPVETRDEPARKGSGRQRGASGADWITRRVYLGRITRSPGRGESMDEDMDTDGLIEATVTVRGHLKRQPYGPGRSLRRWIYVEAFEARRWIAPKPLRIDVM